MTVVLVLVHCFFLGYIIACCLVLLISNTTQLMLLVDVVGGECFKFIDFIF